MIRIRLRRDRNSLRHIEPHKLLPPLRHHPWQTPRHRIIKPQRLLNDAIHIWTPRRHIITRKPLRETLHLFQNLCPNIRVAQYRPRQIRKGSGRGVRARNDKVSGFELDLPVAKGVGLEELGEERRGRLVRVRG